MTEVSTSSSALDDLSTLDTQENSSPSGISATKVSETLPSLNSTGTLNAGNMVQAGQHLNGRVIGVEIASVNTAIAVAVRKRMRRDSVYIPNNDPHPEHLQASTAS